MSQSFGIKRGNERYDNDASDDILDRGHGNLLDILVLDDFRSGTDAERL